MITTTGRECRVCRKPFEAATMASIGISITQQVCEPCIAAWEAANEAREAKPKVTRRDKWLALCEASGFGRYTDFDQDQLPQGIHAKLFDCRIVDDKGLLLIGPTSQGKTYCAIEVARVTYMAGKSVKLVDAIAFGHAVGQADNSKRDSLIESCIAIDVLMIDDLGKTKLTERVGEALFHVVNQRENRRRPIIITTNATGADLKARMAEEQAEPFLARLRRMCRVVNFS